MKYYYLNKYRQPVGPLTEEQLKTAIRTEALVPDTMVLPEGGNEWVFLNSLPGMDDALAAVEDSPMGNCPQCGQEITGFCMPPNCAHCGYEMALPVTERESLWKHFVFALKKSFTLRGRATRMEYWGFFLFSNIIMSVLYTFLGVILFGVLLVVPELNPEQLEENVWMLALFYLVWFLPTLPLCIPYVSVSVRRLHDIGASGWWIPAGILSYAVPFAPLLVSAVREDLGLFIGCYAALCLVPIGIACRIIISHFQDTQRGGNSYGPSSKYLRA